MPVPPSFPSTRSPERVPFEFQAEGLNEVTVPIRGLTVPGYQPVPQLSLVVTANASYYSGAYHVYTGSDILFNWVTNNANTLTLNNSSIAVNGSVVFLETNQTRSPISNYYTFVAEGYNQIQTANIQVEVLPLIVATPTFSPSPGTYLYQIANNGIIVSISDSTPNANIYYTNNGTTPTGSSTLYSGPITLGVSETLKAIGNLTNYLDSDVATATYTLKAITPTFSPPAGTYSTTQMITISNGMDIGNIYYTLDGTIPDEASTLYTGPVTVSTTETIKAIANVSGMLDSDVGTAVYTISSIPAPTITATSNGSFGYGVYYVNSDQPYTISYTTTNATSVNVFTSSSAQSNHLSQAANANPLPYLYSFTNETTDLYEITYTLQAVGPGGNTETTLYVQVYPKPGGTGHYWISVAGDLITPTASSNTINTTAVSAINTIYGQGNEIIPFTGSYHSTSTGTVGLWALYDYAGDIVVANLIQQSIAANLSIDALTCEFDSGYSMIGVSNLDGSNSYVAQLNGYSDIQWQNILVGNSVYFLDVVEEPNLTAANLYFIGSTSYGVNDEAYQTWIGKFDYTGAHYWQEKLVIDKVNTYNGTTYTYANIQNPSITSLNGNVYITYTFSSNASLSVSSDPIYAGISKINGVDGSIIWQNLLGTKYGDANTSNISQINCVSSTIDSNENVYVIGYATNTIFVAKYDLTGNLVYQKSIYDSTDTVSVHAYSGSTDLTGNLYITGSTSHTLNSIPIISLDSTGNVNWQSKISANVALDATTWTGNEFGHRQIKVVNPNTYVITGWTSYNRYESTSPDYHDVITSESSLVGYVPCSETTGSVHDVVQNITWNEYNSESFPTLGNLGPNGYGYSLGMSSGVGFSMGNPFYNTDTEDFSIEFWFNSNSTLSSSSGSATAPAAAMITDISGYGTADWSMGFQLNMTPIFGGGYVGEGVDVAASNTSLVLNDSQWHHVVGTRNGTTGLMTLYVDGVPVATTNDGAGSRPGTSVWYSGVNPGYGSAGFTGYITQYALYNSELTQSQITNHYNAMYGVRSGGNYALTAKLPIHSAAINLGPHWNMSTTSYANTDTHWFSQAVPSILGNTQGSINFSSYGALELDPGLTFGSGPYTVDMWINVTEYAGQTILTGNGNPGDDTTEYQIFLFVLDGVYGISTGQGGTWYLGSTYPTGSWHHIAIARDSSNNTALWFDGTMLPSAPGGSLTPQLDTFNYTQPSTYIEPSQAYISNFRAVIGSNVYDPNQTTITIPVPPLTNVTNTELLLITNRTYNLGVDNFLNVTSSLVDTSGQQNVYSYDTVLLLQFAEPDGSNTIVDTAGNYSFQPYIGGNQDLGPVIVGISSNNTIGAGFANTLYIANTNSTNPFVGRPIGVIEAPLNTNVLNVAPTSGNSWCIECFFNPTDLSVLNPTYGTLWGYGGSTAESNVSDTAFRIGAVSYSGGGIGWVAQGLNQGWDQIINNNVLGTGPITLGAWHHIALVWDYPDQRLSFYCDGVRTGTYKPFVYPQYSTAPENVLNPPSSQYIIIGGDDYYYTTACFDGYVGEFRITTGARPPYQGATYTVPTKSFTATQFTTRYVDNFGIRKDGSNLIYANTTTGINVQNAVGGPNHLTSTPLPIQISGEIEYDTFTSPYVYYSP